MLCHPKHNKPLRLDEINTGEVNFSLLTKDDRKSAVEFSCFGSMEMHQH